MFNLKKLTAAFLTAAVALTAMPLTTPAYEFNPTELMYLAGVKMSMEDGVSYELFDIDQDTTSELLVATETAKGDRLDIYGYDEGTKQPKELKTMKNVTAVYSGVGRMAVEEKTKSTAKYTVLRLNDKGKIKTVRTYRAVGKKGNVTYYMNARTISASKYKKAVKKLKKNGELTFITVNPWYDSNIIGVAETLGSDPGAVNDFSLHVNYDYLMEHHLETGGYSAGTFDDAEIELANNINSIIEGTASAGGEDAKYVNDYYTMGTDWETRDALGAAPLKKIIDDISAISTISDLNAYLSDPERSALEGFFESILDCDTNVKKYTALFQSDELTTDSDSEEAAYYGIDRADFDYIVNFVLGKAGYAQDMIDHALEDTYAFDNGMWDLYLEDFFSTDDSTVSVSELTESVKNFPMRDYLAAYGLTSGEIIFYSPKVLSALDEIYTEDKLPMLKSVLITKTAYKACQYLDYESAALAYGFFDMLSADEDDTDRLADDEIKDTLNKNWEETINTPDCLMFAALVNAYIENFLDPDTEAELREMTASIKAGFREILEEEDWLSKETKAAALKKLDAMTFTVGSPEEPIDTSHLEIDPTLSLLDTEVSLSSRYKLHTLSASGKLIKDGEVCRYDLISWFNPLVVNAGNYFQMNHFYIPPGVMTETLFDKDMSYEKKLGGLGSIIGHEITHGYDPSGSIYDENGDPIDGDCGFFTPEDASVYQAKVDKVVSYCNRFQFVPASPLLGDIVKGEVVADMGGIKIGLHLAKKTEGFDYEEYFKSYAWLWEQQTTLEAEESNVMNEHPRGVFRVNATVQQFDEFYQTFGVKEGDKMYLAPEERVAIW